MTIETKFNTGDKVYVLFKDFIRVGFIIKIRVIVSKENHLCDIQYIVQVKDHEPYVYNENETHATKENLCKFLSMYVS